MVDFQELDHTFVVAHSFSSDATNSGVWRNSKLQGLQLQSAYLVDHRSLALVPFLSCLFSFESFVDLQKVPNNNTAGAVSAIIWKQLAGVGCPVWKNYAGMLEPRGGASVATAELPGNNRVIRVFLYTSDGGSDQTKFKKILVTDTAPLSRVLVVVYPCLMHCVQLIIRSGLALVDKWLQRNGKTWKYFSSLSKVTQAWLHWKQLGNFTHCTPVSGAIAGGRSVGSRCYRG